MKTKILLSFPKHLTGQPITYRLIKDFDLQINILRASIDYNVEGKLLLEIIGSEEMIDQAMQFLRDQGLRVELYEKRVIRNDDECIHCGACTAVCSAEALHFNPDTWKLEFDTEKCLVCGLCVTACPLRIIEVTL